MSWLFFPQVSQIIFDFGLILHLFFVKIWEFVTYKTDKFDFVATNPLKKKFWYMTQRQK